MAVGSLDAEQLPSSGTRFEPPTSLAERLLALPRQLRLRDESVWAHSLTIGYAAIDQICEYYKTLEQRDVKSSVKPGYLLEQLSSKSVSSMCFLISASGR